MARDTRVQDDADKAADGVGRGWAAFEAQRQQREQYQAECRKAVEVNEVLMNCIECGETIPRQRQLALPHTRRCVGCASDVERAWNS